MHIEWYGQSAFRLSDGATTVFVDPFDDLTALHDRRPPRLAGRRGARRRLRARRGRGHRARPQHAVRVHARRAAGAHLGDLGQRALRAEQREALGTVDVLFVPVGGGATIGAEQATRFAAELGASVIVPMHHQTERIDFLEPVDAFVALAARTERLDSPAFELDALPAGDTPLVVVPAAP